jgi:16S rRNA (guanine(966)-N(2))-methyltransferase RsmD
MSDKVRGALFNILGDLNGLSMLDAFSGTGACSFEAASRGANHIIAIDIEQDSVKTIAANIRELDLADIIKVTRANVRSWIATHPEDDFDIVIADPPYDDIKIDLLEIVSSKTRPGGVFTVSLPGNLLPFEFQGFDMISHKAYGDAQLAFYRRTS